MDDCLIIGAGAVGLSLAYELAIQGLQVRVIDRGEPGKEASWAGAGIFPPGKLRPQDHPYQQLYGLSNQLHADWAGRLRDETGVDNGYHRCGALYLSIDGVDQRDVSELADEWRAGDLHVESLTAQQVGQLEPGMAEHCDRIRAAYLLPDEVQIRNPRHLRALAMACGRRGVEIVSNVVADDFEIAHGRVTAVQTSIGRLQAGSVCLCAGSWSQALANRLGLHIEVRPIRGQIVLLACSKPLVERVVNVWPRYMVPRSDGRLLVGSTLEDVGFDRRNTPAAVALLLQFAIDLVPALAEATIERCWAGLRPRSADNWPYLGRTPGLDNAYVATGHYRSGLQLSPGTAVVMSQLIRGERPSIDLAPFRVDRTPRPS